MKFFRNIWQHPRTSVAGMLIAIGSISGVLAQQGITLGNVGTGTVVSLVSATAAALLGLLAKDPDSGAGQKMDGSSSGQAKLGVWALIALLMPLPFLGGCSAKSVAQNIVDWTPALQSAVASVDSTAALLSPADAPVFASATAGFDAAAEMMITQARAYLTNPSAGTLTQMQTQVVVLQQQVNVAMLQALRIVNPESQKHALAAIQAVGTVVTVMLSLVQSVSGRAEIARMAGESSVKFSAVLPLVDQRLAAEAVAAHYGESVAMAEMQVAAVARAEIAAGF